MLRLAVVLVLGVLAQAIYVYYFAETFADEPEAIVGGTPAARGEFPYQCSLLMKGDHFCGASIITPTKILTAAHCVNNLEAPYNNLEIVTGSIDKYLGKRHHVKKITIHPKYTGAESWVNHIAVITLLEPIQYDDVQKSIPLASSLPRAGTQCTLAGWGKTQANGPSPQYLLKISIALLNNQECQNYFGTKQPIYSSHLCAFNKRGIGACNNDSGGPLICDGQQYGVVSFSFPCAIGVPDVYSSVFHQLSFIRRCITDN